jgi:hypothetical protein
MGAMMSLLKSLIKKSWLRVRKLQACPLEYRPMKTDGEKIIEREGHWKEDLLSRRQFGYSKN